jgi:hypothetical protein
VIAQDTLVGRNFTKRAVVGQFLCHSLASWHSRSARGCQQWASLAGVFELP